MIPAVLTVDGRDVSPTTRYDVSVEAGRDDTDGQPDANVLDVTMDGWDDAGTVGSAVVLTDDDGQLFAGTVTDLVTELDPAAGIWVTRISATSGLANVGRVVVGDEPWPAETDSARVARILTLAGVAHAVNPGIYGPVILARDVDAKSALELAQEVAQDALGVLWDDPKALSDPIRYSPQRLRGWAPVAITWGEVAPSEAWANVSPTATWQTATSDVIGGTAGGVYLTLDAAYVRAEVTLEQRIGDLIRKARVTYGAADPQPEAVAGSGLPQVRRETQLENGGDAAAVADLIVRGHHEPRWQLREAVIPLHAIGDVTTRKGIRNSLTVGTRLTLVNIDWDSPIGTTWQGSIEGWRHELDGIGEHRLILHVSDRVLTEPADRWQDVPVTVTWGNVDPVTTWDTAVIVGG